MATTGNGIGVAQAETESQSNDTSQSPSGENTQPSGGQQAADSDTSGQRQGQAADPGESANDVPQMNINVSGGAKITGQEGPDNDDVKRQMNVSVSGGANVTGQQDPGNDDVKPPMNVSVSGGAELAGQEGPEAQEQLVAELEEGLEENAAEDQLLLDDIPPPSEVPSPPEPVVAPDDPAPTIDQGSSAPNEPPTAGGTTLHKESAAADLDDPAVVDTLSDEVDSVSLFSMTGRSDPAAESFTMTAAAAPPTPSPVPLVWQPSNPIEAFVGGVFAVINIALTAVSMFISSILAPGPTTPAPPMMLFVALGWAQRELQRTFLNQSPAAGVDAITTSEDTDVTIAVLDNDTDGDLHAGDVLTVTDYTQAGNGTVTLNANGTFTYSPNAGFVGTDTFSYTVSDAASPWHLHGLAGFFGGGGHTSTTTVTVTVDDADDAPTVGDPAFSLDDPDADTGVVTGRLNVTNPGSTLTYTVVTDPTDGVVTMNAADGTFTYKPTAAARLRAGLVSGDDFDSFTVEVSEGVTPLFSITVTDVPIAAGEVVVTDTITVGDDPRGAAVSPDGTLAYIANAFSRTVSVIDTTTNDVIATITVGVTADRLWGIALNADGTQAYINILQHDALGPTDKVVVIDTTTRTVVGTPITVGDTAAGVASNGTHVYVTNYDDDTVSVIDTTTNTVTDTITVGDGPTSVAARGRYAYVINSLSGTVSVIDTTTNTITDTITVSGGPTAVAISPDGTRAYTANFGSGTVSVIDTTTNTITDTIAVSGGPSAVAISPDGTLAYIASNNTGTVSVIDTTTNTVITTVTVGSDPSAVAFSPDGTAYVANNDSGTVSVISIVSTPAIV
ncbi:Ig-like domain-containing protein [Mycolicibacterium sp. XJ2]